jgi:hypothetical protein
MSNAKKWIKKNSNWLWKYLGWYGIFFGIIILLITLLIARFLGDVVITSSGMLESLVQAQATVLSLFGIIIAYLLNVNDSKLDRLEQETFEIENLPEEKRDKKLYDFTVRRYETVREHKRRIAKGCLLIGSILVLSLLLSVIAFSLRGIGGWGPLKILVSALDMLLFFIGIFGIFSILNRIGK